MCHGESFLHLIGIGNKAGTPGLSRVVENSLSQRQAVTAS
jgi:hypothetical protein